jgi:hypothetical protein
VLSPKKLFLTIRVFFKIPEQSPEALSLFFIQTYASVMDGKIRLREDDYMNLAALKLCSEVDRIRIEDVNKIPLYHYIPIHIMYKHEYIVARNKAPSLSRK